MNVSITMLNMVPCVLNTTQWALHMLQNIKRIYRYMSYCEFLIHKVSKCKIYNTTTCHVVNFVFTPT